MASRVFHAMFDRGLFDTAQTGDKDADVTSEAHSLLARDLSAAATALLQNNNGCLPLDAAAVSSIALVGTRAHDDPILVGGGSGGVQPKYIVTALDGTATMLPRHHVISSTSQFTSSQFTSTCDYVTTLPT
jgi:beta-glucosidase